jgi:zinc-binding alcohol dehydrogenase family protein
MATTMKAVASYTGLPIDDKHSLLDVALPAPTPRSRDVIVAVQAVSVNPADVKKRSTLHRRDIPTVLGYDAAGIVQAVGDEVTTLAVGDEVWYSGDFTRQGANADLQAVDERIVARKPVTLDFAEAAALPLTTIVSWETLFDRFQLGPESDGTLVILGGAGGVGSIMIQLAAQLTNTRVIASATTEATRRWVTELGAAAVVDHRNLATSMAAVAPEGANYLFSSHSRGNIDAFAEVLRPFGHITAIDEPEGLDLLPLKQKSITWHWELMFTRSMFQTPDMIEQKHLLEYVAALVDKEKVRTTMTTAIGEFSAAGFREAHRLVETGHVNGKVVVYRQ